MTSPSPACPCGQVTLPPDAKFCHVCGRTVGAARCSACSAQLNPGARFCHRCGTPVNAAPAATLPSGPGASFPMPPAAAPAPATAPATLTPWIIAGTIIVALLAGIIWKVSKDAGTPDAPVMANAGNGGSAPTDGGAAGAPSGAAPFAGGGGGVPTGRAPDISNMSPRERFNRLYDRIMRAASQGDSTTVLNFTPMAIGAYTQLDSTDTDSRFDAAMLYLGIGQFPAATALADTILQKTPGHLFGYVVRGEVARAQKNSAAQARAVLDFTKHYDDELKRARPEYAARRGILDEFRQTNNIK